MTGVIAFDRRSLRYNAAAHFSFTAHRFGQAGAAAIAALQASASTGARAR